MAGSVKRARIKEPSSRAVKLEVEAPVHWLLAEGERQDLQPV